MFALRRYCFPFLQSRGCPTEFTGAQCPRKHAIPAAWRCDNCKKAGVHRFIDCDLGYCAYFRRNACSFFAKYKSPCPLPHTVPGKNGEPDVLVEAPPAAPEDEAVPKPTAKQKEQVRQLLVKFPQGILASE